MKFLTLTHHLVCVHWDSTESMELAVNVVLELFITVLLWFVKEFVNSMKSSMEQLVFVPIISIKLTEHVLNVSQELLITVNLKLVKVSVK